MTGIKRIYVLATALMLTGCGAADWMDRHVGSHMPVMGERCENWQCFTKSGQRESEYKKKLQARGGQMPEQAATTPTGRQMPKENSSGMTTSAPSPTPDAMPAPEGDAETNPYDWYRP